MSGLYDNDILLWSQRQAQLLRRLAAGERVNDQVDWENVIEEVESVGSEQLHAVESLLVQALVHISRPKAGQTLSMRQIGAPRRYPSAAMPPTDTYRPCGSG